MFQWNTDSLKTAQKFSIHIRFIYIANIYIRKSLKIFKEFIKKFICMHICYFIHVSSKTQL